MPIGLDVNIRLHTFTNINVMTPRNPLIKLKPKKQTPHIIEQDIIIGSAAKQNIQEFLYSTHFYRTTSNNISAISLTWT